MGDSDQLTERVGRLETRTDRIDERLGRIEVDVASIKATLPHLATRADVQELRAEMKGDIHATALKVVMWNVGTIIAMAGLAFAIARFVK